MLSHPVPVVDPDHVQEVFCDGTLNVNVAPVSTLTFTHIRPVAASLLADRTGNSAPELEAVVRARLLLPFSSLVALRDVLNKLIKDDPASTAGTGSATGHSIN